MIVAGSLTPCFLAVYFSLPSVHHVHKTARFAVLCQSVERGSRDATLALSPCGDALVSQLPWPNIEGPRAIRRKSNELSHRDPREPVGHDV
ncbi:uncharacterized protein P884DRAFT_255511 [Thermothelomyces heterothallicus CBS 202.75]|uniref:uncharacterized protein n=1 Tax=Thermothelomyces heterothallicus CBS 202.75 TaxID=1149848 RepID=UPI0037431306